MDNLDKLAMVSKSLFDVRVVEQRQEIEKLKKELKKFKDREDTIRQKQNIIREAEHELRDAGVFSMLRSFIETGIVEYSFDSDIEESDNGCVYIHKTGTIKGCKCLDATSDGNEYCNYHNRNIFKEDIENIIADLLGIQKESFN